MYVLTSELTRLGDPDSGGERVASSGSCVGAAYCPIPAVDCADFQPHAIRMAELTGSLNGPEN